VIARRESALRGRVVLVDTSVWIAVFRKTNPLRLADLVDFEEVTTCLPVVQETLQGFREESAFRRAREAMLAMPIVEAPLRIDLVEDAVALYRSGRRAGLTIRSSVDCLIAACALRHNLTVLHHDRDFDLLRRVSSLQTRNLAS
jgi:predicted nucleic acid-binding protein